MAIIYSYPETTQILLTDMLIGTSTIRVAGKKKNLTKNFTIETLGGFIHDNFPTQWGEITGTLSTQTDLQAALDSKQGNITLTTIGTSGVSTLIGDILNIPNYTVVVPTKTSDLINDGEDGIHPFITAEDIPPSTSTLNDVLTNGNTSLLDAKVGTLGLWDTGNSYYNKIGSIGNDFYFMLNSGAATFVTGSGSTRFSTTSGTLELFNNGVNGYKAIYFPDAGGTFALTSDIPGALTFTSPLVDTLGVITIDQSNTTTDGYLSSIDWNTFNNKQDTITLTTTGTSGAATFIANTLNIPNYSTDLSGYVPTSRTLTINGIGYDLTADRSWTIPTGTGTVTSVGLSMPSAFTVSNSPITGAGTIAVSGAGTASQYIRGDGQLATLPSGGGGGSSVNYYLNGSVNASVATYKQLSNTAIIGAGTDFTLTGNGLISQFLTDVGNPNRTEIPGGGWNFEMFFSMSSNGGTPAFYVELLKYDGATFTSIASSSAVPENITGGTSIDLYLTSLAVPTTPLLVTDRLAIRVYIVNNSGGRTAKLHTEDSHLCEIITTFSGGVTSLNGLTANTQYLSVGTTGTDFNINSLVDIHTFNLPTASATNRGALSTADWTTFNTKQDALTNPITGTGTTNYLPKFTGTSALGDSLIFANGTNVGIGTASPNASSVLDLTSTTKGFLPPRMTTVQKNAIATPVEGLVVYDTTLSTLFQYNNSNWIKLTSGIHTNIKPTSGNSTTLNINSTALTSTGNVLNRIHLIPYVPAQTITSVQLYINSVTANASAAVRILIYSDLNGAPNTRLYESTTLDCSTSGLKTATTVFTFKSGTTYWIGTHTGVNTSTLTAILIASLIPISINGTTIASSITDSTYTFGSAPATFGSTYAYASVSTPFVGITL